jgi:hypothetical protein
MAVAYGLVRTGPWDFYTKPALEWGAILLTGTALLLALVHLSVTRTRLQLLLCAVAVTVMCREFHWDWTTKAVYASLGLIAAIAFVWRADLVRSLDRSPTLRVWLTATAVTYVLSQAIARRAFRGIIPDEELVYSDMEELVENVAHLMLAVTVMVGPWRRKRPE